MGPVIRTGARAVEDSRRRPQLTAIGRDPTKNGILWQTPITVGVTEAEALARREKLLTVVPLAAVGASPRAVKGEDSEDHHFKQ